MLKILIVAENYQTFRDYCYAQGIPLDGSARYISQATQLHGMTLYESQLRFVGYWHRLPDANKITAAVNAGLKKGSAL